MKGLQALLTSESDANSLKDLIYNVVVQKHSFENMAADPQTRNTISPCCIAISQHVSIIRAICMIMNTRVGRAPDQPQSTQSRRVATC